MIVLTGNYVCIVKLGAVNDARQHARDQEWRTVFLLECRDNELHVTSKSMGFCEYLFCFVWF